LSNLNVNQNKKQQKKEKRTVENQIFAIENDSSSKPSNSNPLNKFTLKFNELHSKYRELKILNDSE